MVFDIILPTKKKGEGYLRFLCLTWIKMRKWLPDKRCSIAHFTAYWLCLSLSMATAVQLMGNGVDSSDKDMPTNCLLKCRWENQNFPTGLGGDRKNWRERLREKLSGFSPRSLSYPNFPFFCLIFLARYLSLLFLLTKAFGAKITES